MQAVQLEALATDIALEFSCQTATVLRGISSRALFIAA